jgi:hypothetical protein
MQTFRLAALMFLALISTAVSARAQVVVYNSFGAGNTYNSGIVWGVSGASTSGAYRGQAEFFTPSTSGNLDFVQLATFNVSGSRLSNFFIAQDNGAGAPGAILEAFTNITVPNGLLTLNSTPGVFLQAGTEYWLADEPATAASYNGWYENSQGVANGFAFERSQWSWAPIGPPAPNSGVFRVTVNPVPEPTVTALGIASGCSLLFWRFRKNAFQRGTATGRPTSPGRL